MKTYGPIEFFLTTMAFDTIADQYGTNRIEEIFEYELKRMKEE